MAPAPSMRFSSLARRAGGSWSIAAATTFRWSATVLEPALPGRSSMARDSLVLAHHAARGWNPKPFLKVTAAPALAEWAVIRVASRSMTIQPVNSLPAT